MTHLKLNHDIVHLQSIPIAEILSKKYQLNQYLLDYATFLYCRISLQDDPIAKYSQCDP